MSLENLSIQFPWYRYSKKVGLRIDTSYCMGIFTAEEATKRNLHYAQGMSKSNNEGNHLVLFWLVDLEDGVIIDSRFQAFGNSALIAAAECACEMLVGKNYDQAARISSDLLDHHVRDKNDAQAFPKEAYSHLNIVLEAIDHAAAMCQGIPLATNYVAPPITNHEIEILEGGYPGWKELQLKQKLAVIEEVLNKEVRPYIELDAGGVEVLNLVNDREVYIAYQGNCTSCYSATGATLTYIQQVLRAKVHPEIEVIPDLPNL